MDFSHKKALLLGLLLLLALSIPLTLQMIQNRHQTRSQAEGTTMLTFEPTSSNAAPIQTNLGDTIALDMMVDPGDNLVTFVRFQVEYDPTKLEVVSDDPFTINTAAFPLKIEGPVLGTGTVAESLSIGSDVTKALQEVTKVGTITFKAIGGTGDTPTTVTFTNLTQTLSSGSDDEAAENVLANTTPASILISGDLTATPSATPSVTITPEPTVATTSLTFDLLLHGIGAAGDNPNPSGNSLSNKNPLHPQRDLEVEIIDSNNQVVATTAGAVIYDSGSESFKGTLDLGASFPTGNYNIKLKTDRYLRRLVPGIQAIENLKENDIPQVDLIAGDVDGDNVLNVLDYNAFLDCGYGELDPLPLTDPNAIFNNESCQIHNPALNTDVDDNGIINSSDYNLFLRELSVQNGD
jgi:hypothetical protein